MKALKKSLIAFLSIIFLVSSKVEKKEKFLLVETKGDEGENARGDVMGNKNGDTDYSQHWTDKEPFPIGDPGPTCSHPPCIPSEIKVQVYVSDGLVKKYRLHQLKHGKDSKSINSQIQRLFTKSNQDLERLDEGGFKIVQQGKAKALSRSDVEMGKSFVDRYGGNRTRYLSDHLDQMFAYGLTFQQSVERMPNRGDVDLRILFIDRGNMSYPDPMGLAEEFCICKQNGHGCIIVFAIKNIARWDTHVKVLSHDIGHTLGVFPHADSYYKVPKKDTSEATFNIDDLYDDHKDNKDENVKLLMWPDVYEDAEIWSTWAREQIKSQDNTCLKKGQPITVKDTVKESLIQSTMRPPEL